MWPWYIIVYLEKMYRMWTKYVKIVFMDNIRLLCNIESDKRLEKVSYERSEVSENEFGWKCSLAMWRRPKSMFKDIDLRTGKVSEKGRYGHYFFTV